MTNVMSLPKLSEMTYRVLNVLGTGAGSTILLVSDKTAGGKQYALKVVKRQDADDDIYIAQAMHEFEVVQRLNHESIVKIHDLRVKKAWFRVTGVELLMEYVEGHTLDEIEAPGIKDLVLIFNQVAAALGHMHRRGVYHGDLKPSNIMVRKDGRVKLIDFGTAWIKGDDKNRVQGTPQYMAPEQATERQVDERTDIYNFGATMYRMFTGRYAQQGIPILGDASTRKLTSPILIQPAIPGTVNETILACLQVDPNRRPAGVFEIKHQLAAAARYLGLDPNAPVERDGEEEEDDE
jgi:eukaryotic-like serine/threonine-protein kinase